MAYLGKVGREGIAAFAGLVLMLALAGCNDGGAQSGNGGAGGASAKGGAGGKAGSSAKGGAGGTAGATASGGVSGGAGTSAVGGSAGSSGAGGAAGGNATGGAGGAAGATSAAGAGGAAGTAGSAGSASSIGGAAGTTTGGAGGAAGTTATGGAGGGAGATPTGGSGAGSGGNGGSFNAATRDVDILFVVDNSSSMTKSQTKLLHDFPLFIQALTALPGGMPNLHIAVVSSDMGAGTGTGGCAGNGQDGLFQWGAPGSSCPATTDGARFLSNVNGIANYTGALTDLFSCIAALGQDGCGFEQPLLSTVHALGADSFDLNGHPQPPGANAGFLRDDAYLVIVVITNEDDCSAFGGASSDLYPRSGDGSNLSSTLGPPTGYRCVEFGYLCGDPPAPPPRLAPDPNAPVTLTSCVPAEEDGKLLSIASFEAVLKNLKADPARQIIVAALAGFDTDAPTGPPSSLTIDWRASPGDPTQLWPEPKHNCVAQDMSFADPAIRIGTLAQRFGDNGILRSICADELTPALQQVASRLSTMMTAP